MKKLLFISTTLGGGGAERIILYLVNEFAKDKNNSVTLLLLKKEGNTYLDSLSPQVKMINLNISGMILTAIIQSSSASVGILQALSATGAISVGAAFPIILGQNIGTCVTALISSIGTNKNAKRTAVIHLTFNIIGVVCGMALFYGANAIFHFAFLDKAVNGADIAAIHTAFNVFCTVLLFPFGKQLEKLSCLIVRDKTDKTQPAAADSDALVEERFLMSPSFAIEKCRERTNDMARLAQKNTLLSLGFIRVYNKKDSEAIHQNEKALDAFEDELETYLVKISSMQLSLENSMQVSKLSHAIGNFERIGDYAVNILKTKRTMHEDKIHFSKEASKELEVMSSAGDHHQGHQRLYRERCGCRPNH